MRYRDLSFLAALLLLSALVIPSVVAASSPNAKRAKVNQMVAMLPASDMVATIDVKRFFGDALPRLLSANQPMLAEWLGKIDSMSDKSGIDLRQFEFLAVGLNAKFVSEKNYELEPVILARGTVNSQDVIVAARQASAERFREEAVNGKTMFTFSMTDLANKIKTDETAADAKPMIDKILIGTSSEISISAVDSNTVAIGSPERVRTLIGARSKVGSDITRLLDRKPFAVINFAGKAPGGLKSYLPLESDDLGKSIDAIRFAYGSMDVANGEMAMSLSARLERLSQAEQLYDTLELMKAFGGGALGNSQRADQQLYARLIQSVKLSRNGNEISLDLAIPQSDVDLLIAMLTK
ncbi:MAG TPA: hypothetical protein PKD24_16880 [Pyrinomonadaceae bacterium]|nr:hypothetical protein [Pyrinomonadaceae bacterium]HMP66696.1 hypothetical protein [Pyrinomonadaceae bacterium]